MRGILMFLIGLVLLGPSIAPAQELTLYGGSMTSIESSEKTYAWRLEYQQGLSERFQFTWSWLNEGHVVGHHRDGHLVQVWVRHSFDRQRVTLAGGVGPYRFYDTQTANPERGFADVHGTGVMLSESVGYYLADRVVLRGELNHVWAPRSSIDTWSALLGVGYQLEAPDRRGPRQRPEREPDWKRRAELTLFGGRTVVNSDQSQKGIAGQLSYRRGIDRYFAWTIDYINEGHPQVIRRNGVASQLFARRSFLRAKLEIGVGVGLYYAIDQKFQPGADGKGKGTIAGLVTPSFSWRIENRWDARLNWERTVTAYDRDTDLFQLGIGYRF